MSVGPVCASCLDVRHYNCQVIVGHMKCDCLARGHTEAVLPYAGTQGHSGTDTSRERAEREATDGTAKARQSKTLEALGLAAAEGLTVKELCAMTGWHHGQASSTLSVLHKDGLIARLSERRQKCKVYIKPVHTSGRDVEQHGRKPKTSDSELVVLQRRLVRAEDMLTQKTAATPSTEEANRLIHKRTGVRLALSYVEEMLR